MTQDVVERASLLDNLEKLPMQELICVTQCLLKLSLLLRKMETRATAIFHSKCFYPFSLSWPC